MLILKMLVVGSFWVAANAGAQAIFPTKTSDPFERKLIYGIICYGVLLGGLLTVIFVMRIK